MSKPVGGRGMRATYKTTHVRVPEPVKPAVERIIEDYHKRGGIQAEYTTSTLEDALVYAKDILSKRVSAKVGMSKLLTAIYGTDVYL